MALKPGDLLGPYRIQALLGIGGMGEVYRARDTRLGRDAALKVIAPRLLGDTSLRRRFEVEARAASVLNHPAIVTISDIGESGAVSWIAMEYAWPSALQGLSTSGWIGHGTPFAMTLASLASFGGWAFSDPPRHRVINSGQTKEVPMKCRIRLASLMAVVALLAAGDLLACGDKFLVGSRGTRYQRPKNVRAASILIYANPSSDIGSARVQSMLKRQGHRAITVTTFEQLSAILSDGHFDVVLAASDVTARIQQLFAGVPDAAVVLAFDAPPNGVTLLNAIDKAVEQRDQDLRRNRTRS